MRIRLAGGRLAPWVCLVLMALPPGSAHGSGLVDYYPGKDEICLEAEPQSLLVDLKRLLIVVEVYGPDDRELSCTVEVTLAGDLEDDRRFSASAHRCRELLEAPSHQRWRLEVVGDHLCGLTFEE
jgi:hypothetical protein